LRNRVFDRLDGFQELLLALCRFGTGHYVGRNLPGDLDNLVEYLIFVAFDNAPIVAKCADTKRVVLTLWRAE
jgi:hypothetical protein